MTTTVSSAFRFLEDETTISQKLEVPILSPIRIFSLDGLGLDQEKFLSTFAPLFSFLTWDIYDVKFRQTQFLLKRYPEEAKRLKLFLERYYEDAATLEMVEDLLLGLSAEDRKKFNRTRPDRKRSICKFLLTANSDGSWQVQQTDANNFAQQVEKSDDRSLRRVFQPTTHALTQHPYFANLLVKLADLVHSIRPECSSMVITMHQVSIIALPYVPGDNSPEGIHQDGADYIVSALVIEREGIKGGESIIYGPDKKTVYYRTVLQPGQGIFQADAGSSLWHDVTPIFWDQESRLPEGRRSIIGFDIMLSQ